MQKQFSDAAADLSPGDVEGKGINKVIRVVIGVLILLCLQKGLKIVLPSEAIFSFIRYSIISIFGIGIYPMMFKKLKI